MTTGADVVHGLRAAAKLTGRSPSGLQKMVDAGRVPAERDGRAYVFHAADLEAIRRLPGQPQASGLAAASPATGPSSALPPDLPAPAAARPEMATPVHSSAADDAQEEGAVAAMAFADFRAGKSIIDVVIDRRLPPDVARRVHGEWLALSDVDALLKPDAEVRLAQVEADLQSLASQLTALEESVHEVSTTATRGRQEVDARLRVMGARSHGVSMPAAIYQRLDSLEAKLGSLPAGPLVLPDRRCGCGAPLFVFAGCSGCGAGRVAS